jgi:predicted acetylornithine/succinylornithine family transaminase
MDLSEMKAGSAANIINTYGERRLSLVRGEGTKLWDSTGREYLDFFSGISVTNLGHCHPAVTDALCAQAKKLLHISNLYYIEPQVQLAALLCEHTFADRWFFCNSGAEANEAAIKIARRYWAQKGTPRPVILTAKKSFHGRTLTTLAATAQPKYQEGFEPLPPGFEYVEYNDIDSLRAAMRPEVGAVMLEPVLGESGIVVPDEGYLAEVRVLCDKHDALLILDEIQTGSGRTGKLFAYMHSHITPDILTVAKGLGNGVPIGAMGCTEAVAVGFTPGAHGTTFGGNPLCTAAALATMQIMTQPGFLDRATEVGAHFAAGLDALAARYDSIVTVRVKGLMYGVELTKSVNPLIDAMAEAGVICGPAGPQVLRFLPPLIIGTDEADEVLAKLDRALGAF